VAENGKNKDIWHEKTAYAGIKGKIIFVALHSEN